MHESMERWMARAENPNVPNRAVRRFAGLRFGVFGIGEIDVLKVGIERNDTSQS